MSAINSVPKETGEPSRRYGPYGLWEDQNFKKAVRAVFVLRYSKKRAAKTFGIPRSTLQRYIKLCEKDGGVEKKNSGRQTVLTKEQESELTSVIQEMEKRLYGLTPSSVRTIVYQYCELNKISHKFNVESKKAGKKWLRLFLARNVVLSIRKAEGVSIQRALGYNRSKIKIFEDVLRKELFHEDGSRRIPVENIFNVDETGITVNHKPPKIIATKGKKSVATITSAEKGKTVTAMCCMSAAGVYCPPFMIFPRKRFKPELLDKGPVGACGVASPSGWINESLFTEWFDHFVHFFQPQHRASPCLLIMDGHASHTNNLHLINKARANNVSLLILPSHCTHKIQPLDVAVFKSLKCHYDLTVGDWLHAHPGRALQESNVAELFAFAWGKAATVANAVSGFKKSRINPFTETNSDDEDFLGADVTDISLESLSRSTVSGDAADRRSEKNIGGLSKPVTVAIQLPESRSPMATTSDSVPVILDSDQQSGKNIVGGSEPVTVAIQPSESPSPMATTSDSVPVILDADRQPEKNIVGGSELVTVAIQPPDSPMATTSDSVPVILDAADWQSEKIVSSLNMSFTELIPIPKCSQNSRSKRAVAHAKIITASPYKRKLEETEAEKKRKVDNKKARLQKSLERERIKNDRRHLPVKAKQSAQSKEISKTKRSGTRNQSQQVTSKSEDGKKEDATPCLYCEVPYNESHVDWSQCPKCEKWLCDTCVRKLRLIKKGKRSSFRCGTC